MSVRATQSWESGGSHPKFVKNYTPIDRFSQCESLQEFDHKAEIEEIGTAKIIELTT